MREKNLEDARYDAALQQAREKRVPIAAIAPLLTAAHEAGDARATYALATWYLHGQLGRDLRKAVKLLREAASKNIADALYDLAVCYELGEGVRKSERKAAEAYMRAALHGEKQSVYEVGRCYYHGIGVEKDRQMARVWLDRADELGVSEEED